MKRLELKSVKSASMGLVTFAILVTAAAAGAADIDKVRTFRDGEVFVTELVTLGAWEEPEATATFNGSVVQVEIPQGNLVKGKHLVKPDDRVIKSIALSTTEAGFLRAKMTLKEGLLARSLDGRVRVHRRADNTVSVEVEGDAAKGLPEKGESEIARLLPVLTGEGDDASVNAKLVAATVENAGDGVATGANAQAEVSAQALPVVDKKIDTSKLSESEIPVLTAPLSEKKAGGFDLQRVVITLAVLATLLGGTVVGLKRWAAKSAGKNTSNTKIKVLTQHHLGPKKSVVIIQVAGESLLIGVTDHNISMLKALSLLDDEVPEEVPQHFGNSLSDFGDDDDVENARAPRGRRRQPTREVDPEEDFTMRGLSEIRDVVSTRLKGFKNF